LALKTKAPSEYRRGLENHKRKVFEPLYFIKGDKTKAPSEYRRGLENHKRKVFEPLYFIKGEKTT
jgi:hypothetical protein